MDAVIFVFSLENEASFNAIYNYYAKMCQYRNMQEIPLILVGTQGTYLNFVMCNISSSEHFDHISSPKLKYFDANSNPASFCYNMYHEFSG